MAFSSRHAADACVTVCDAYRNGLPPHASSEHARVWTRQENRRNAYVAAQPYGAVVESDSSYDVTDLVLVEE